MGSDRNPDLSDVIRAGMDRRAAAMRTVTVGRVESYDAARGLVSVQPSIQERYLDREGVSHAERLPVIENVPVLWMGGGGMRATYPIAVGDFALLLISDRSLDKWLSYGGEVDPVFEHTHTLTDAVAIVGLRPQTAPWQGADGSVVTIGSETGTTDWAALATSVKNEITALRNTVNALVSAYNGHGHNVATAGSAAAQVGTTGAPFVAGVGTATPPLEVSAAGTAPAAVGDVKSLTVKVAG